MSTTPRRQTTIKQVAAGTSSARRRHRRHRALKGQAPLHNATSAAACSHPERRRVAARWSRPAGIQDRTAASSPRETARRREGDRASTFTDWSSRNSRVAEQKRMPASPAPDRRSRPLAGAQGVAKVTVDSRSRRGLDRQAELVSGSTSRLHTYLLSTRRCSEHIVVDGAAVAHQQHRLALSVDRAPHLPMLDQLLLSRLQRPRTVRRARPDGIRRAELINQWPRPGRCSRAIDTVRSCAG